MKIIKQNNKKPLQISCILFIVIIFFSSFYFYISKNSIFGWSPFQPTGLRTSPDTNPPTKEQIDSGAQIKNNSLSEESLKPGSSGSDRPNKPVPQPNDKSLVDVTITAVNQNNPTLQVRALIGIVDNAGVCTLTLSKASADTITLTSGVHSLSSGATCQGFDIPLAQLSQGDWKLVISFENESVKGSGEKNITIK